MKHFLLYITLLITLNGAAQQFRLEITAQDSLSKKVLDSIKPGELYKDYKAASESLEALSKKLAQLGYFENSISPITKTSDSLFNSTLSIGNQYENILVLTYKLDQRSLEYMSITQDTLVLKPEQVERFMNNNLTIWFEKGFSFATLQLTNLKKVSPSSISATLEVDTKELRKIDHIIVKGYEQFPKPFLTHLYNIRKGDRLNLNEINKKLNNFKETPFVSPIKPPELLFTQDSTTLYLYIKKENSNFLDGFLGFSNNATDQKIKLNGYLKLDLTNNLNSGERLSILYRSTENEQRTFKANLELPYLFKSPIGLDAALEIFKQDSTFLTTNQKISSTYQISKKMQLAAGYQRTNSTSLDSLNTFIEDFTTNSFIAGFKYNLTSPLDFRPNNLNLNLGFGVRKSTAKENVIDGTLEASKSIALNNRNIIYIKNSNHGLFTENPLQNQLFRLGGIKSIRGFEEQSIPATLASILSTEYIYRLGNTMNVFSIIDLGYIEDQTINNTDKLISFGFGLDFIRKSNQLSLIFANGKTSNTNFNFSNSKVHISLTTRF